LKTISLENSPAINSINLLPNEDFILLSAFNNNLNIINVVNEKEIKKFSGHKHKKFLIDCGIYYDVNNNKNYIFSGDEDGFLCCWNCKENNENPFKKKIIEGENCLSVLDVYNDFSNSDNNIVACGLNGDKNNSIYVTKLKENLNV
jgi:WD40 repeat protein